MHLTTVEWSAIEQCAERNIRVALSTWFRQDVDNTRMRINNPVELARVWEVTLDLIDQAGLMNHILYVDLYNEFPLEVWAPFFYEIPGAPSKSLTEPLVQRWMREAIAVLRSAYPGLPYCFSFVTDYDRWREVEVSYLDFLEPHVWMPHFCDFYERVGYHYETFESIGYENLAAKGEALFRQKPEYWQSRLIYGIDKMTEWSRHVRKPLITTECWGLVDYKDWPLLNWEWAIELCEIGVRHASASGRWVALATSNFCGPQFVGMWREGAWHRRMTEIIHRGSLPLFDTAQA